MTDAVFSLLMVVTAYACSPAEGQGYCGLTASGKQVQVGMAACPRWLAFGTRVEIEGLGTYVCEDRYSDTLSDRFDVHVTSVREAFALTGVYRYRLLPES